MARAASGSHDAAVGRRPASRVTARVQVVQDGRSRPRTDHLATEEPLEIRLVNDGVRHSVGVTMRTPGADFELAVGFLHAEGILAAAEQVARITYCTDPDVDAEQLYNIVNVDLAPGAAPDLRPLQRHFLVSSACGVCGKASLDALTLRGLTPPPAGPQVDAEVLYGLPDALRDSQGLFQATGGLHAAGLFDSAGRLLAVREDVGRHNAVDKLVGWALLDGRLPLHDHLLMVSGRTSYEILQKALAAGVPIVCAVSAPSSLAVSLAEHFAMTLVGFLRGRRCNVYAGAERIVLPPA